MMMDLPPFDEDLERGVLGAILIQPDRAHSAALLRDLTPFLDPRDFAREANRLVYLAIVSAYRTAGWAALADVAARLESTRFKQNTSTAWATLAGLCADCTDASIVKVEALALADLGLKRLVMEGRRRLAGAVTASAVSLFNQRVQDKQHRLEEARTGRRRETYDPLTHG